MVGGRMCKFVFDLISHITYMLSLIQGRKWRYWWIETTIRWSAKKECRWRTGIVFSSVVCL